MSGDGRRIVRLRLSRASPWIGLSLLVLALVAPLAVWTDYFALLRQRRAMAALVDRAGERDRVLDSVRRRLLQLQDEIASWRTMHARIWAPLGPEARGGGERTGVGGVGRPVSDPGSDAGSIVQEVEQLAASVADEGQKLRALDRLMARAGTLLASLPTRWPVRGPVNSEFGPRLSPWTGAPETHSGIDIAAEIGTPVRAPAPGVVSFAARTPDYGTTLVLDHGHDIRTLFGHLEKVEVVLGQKVERGQTVALTGNTGRSSGPHLHYEITVRGQPVDPRGYLWD